MSRRSLRLSDLKGEEKAWVLAMMAAMPLLLSGVFLTVLTAEAQQKGRMATVVDGVPADLVQSRVAEIVAAEEGRKQARSMASRAVSNRLRAMADAHTNAPPEEQSLMLAHLQQVSSPERLAEALATPEPLPVAPPSGTFIGFAPMGQRQVRYIAVIPEGYTHDKAWPLHISLHGGGGTPDRSCTVNWQGSAAAKGVILVCPTTYKGQWWVESGERRLLAVLDGVRKQFRVDTNRVSLGGASSGGAGVWHNALKFPWLFRAAVPRCAAMPPHLEAVSNLDRLPVHLMHGARDGRILAANSRNMFEILTEGGYEVEYHEDARVGHQFMTDFNPTLVDWIERKPRAEQWTDFVYHVVKNGPPPTRVHWLRPVWKEGVVPNHTLTGTLSTRGDVFEVALTGTAPVSALTVLLPPTLEEGTTVRVTWDGEVRHEGVVRPSIAGLLDSWAQVRDPALLTPYAVPITLEAVPTGESAPRSMKTF